MQFIRSHPRAPDHPAHRTARRRLQHRAAPVMLAAGGGMLIAACGAGSYAAPATHTAQASGSTRTLAAASDPANHHRVRTRVMVRHTHLGVIIVDDRGRTLYMFTRDRMGESTCRAMCARFWPPDIAHGRPSGGPGITRALLGVTHAADGQRVVTYRGHPLYRFIKDTQPGQITGENTTGFGGRWDVLSPAGRPITGHHTHPTTPRAATTSPGTTAPPATATAPTTAPPPATTTHAAPPPTTTTHATSSGSGIPQNGGGDDDGDNHGSPSDGDGNL